MSRINLKRFRGLPGGFLDKEITRAIKSRDMNLAGRLMKVKEEIQKQDIKKIAAEFVESFNNRKDVIALKKRMDKAGQKTGG